MPLQQNKIGPIVGIAILVLSSVSFGLSLYLSLAEPERLVGCTGADGADCASVLTSKWSRWLGLPVSVGGLMVYGTAILSCIAVLVAGARFGWFLLAGALTAAAGSAIWFISLQIFGLEGICRYCMGTHAFGLAAALLLASDILRHSRSGLRAALGSGAAAGVAVFVVLLTGQIYDRYEIQIKIVDRQSTDSNAAQRARQYENAMGQPAKGDAAETSPKTAGSAGDGRRLTLADGKLEMVLGEYPVLGDLNAPHVIGMLSDYTCPGCRIMHEDIEAALDRYPGEFAVVIFPVALDAKCNPHLERTSQPHQNACLLAKMALALWNTERDAFRRFDHEAFARQSSLERDDIVALGDTLVGAAALDAGMSEALYDKMLYFSINLFHSPLLEKRMLPTLIMPDGVVQGNRESRDELFALLEDRLGLTASAVSTVD